RSIARGVSSDVIHGAIRDHAVDEPARGLVVELDVPRRLAFLRFADVVHILERHPRIAGPIDDVGGLEAEPLVEALIVRQASWPGAEVPLAEHRGPVAG